MYSVCIQNLRLSKNEFYCLRTVLFMIGKATAKRSEKFISSVNSCKEVVIVTHNNPDPDAIAAGWCIRELITKTIKKPVRLVAGGDVVRAENRLMLEVLSPPLELVRHLYSNPLMGIVLVDCSSGMTNHLATNIETSPVAVIDHHNAGKEKNPSNYSDIRGHVAATASIATSYLQEQNIEPSPKLATAILYAIETETAGGESAYSSLDLSIITWLTPRADRKLLAEIRHAPVEPTYYAEITLAFQNSRIYDDTVFCILPHASSPEIVAEVADLLIRCKTINRVFCGAVVKTDMFVSVRTTGSGGNATQLVRAILKGLGNGGGHSRRAGGRIILPQKMQRVSRSLESTLRTRWLVTCDISRSHASRLVSRKKIMSNL